MNFIHNLDENHFLVLNSNGMAELHFHVKKQTESLDVTNNSIFVVVNGYHGDDGYIDGTIRIFSTRQKG